jgi:hypothetical protein
MFKAPLPTPLTVETWQERFYAEMTYDTDMLYGHLHCLSNLLPTLIRMYETAQNFDELKSELITLCDSQRALRNDIDEKWDSEDAEQYNLPERSGPTFS